METVADICREMREHTRGTATEAYYNRESWARLIDRIEAAHKREMNELKGGRDD